VGEFGEDEKLAMDNAVANYPFKDMLLHLETGRKRIKVIDGAQAGAPFLQRANDARNLESWTGGKLGNTARMNEKGTLQTMRTIGGARKKGTRQGQSNSTTQKLESWDCLQKSEILWAYGKAYWEVRPASEVVTNRVRARAQETRGASNLRNLEREQEEQNRALALAQITQAQTSSRAARYANIGRRRATQALDNVATGVTNGVEVARNTARTIAHNISQRLTTLRVRLGQDMRNNTDQTNNTTNNQPNQDEVEEREANVTSNNNREEHTLTEGPQLHEEPTTQERNNAVPNNANTTEHNRMSNPAQGQNEEPLTIIRTNNSQGEAQDEETRDETNPQGTEANQQGEVTANQQPRGNRPNNSKPKIVKRGAQTNIKQATLIQDYEEGGIRAPDVEPFVKALYIKKLRRIVEPHPGVHRNFPLYWLNKYYGHLKQGLRIITSNCDFLFFDSLEDRQAPAEWRAAFKSIGSLEGLAPAADQQGHRPFEKYTELRAGATTSGKERTVAVKAKWSLGEVLMEPIGYNPNLSGWWGSKILDSNEWLMNNKEKYRGVKFLRASKGRIILARTMYQLLERMAGRGVTHMHHIINPGEDGSRYRYNELQRIQT